jgi:5'-nucleotidase
MRILITNDDSIYSPGIATLAQAAATFGDVLVVAPDVERSSAGHSISSARPLRYRRTATPAGFEAYRVDGTPADCVALGIAEWGPIDVVLSGINLGVNLGNAIWHSGTVAAAKQAVLLGVPAVAISTPAPDDEIVEGLEPHVSSVLELLLAHHRLPLVNVNIPSEPRGHRWTRQAVEHYDVEVVPAQDPVGRRVHWFRVRALDPASQGTDRWAFENGYIALTPLRLDLTDHAELQRLAAEDAQAEATIAARPGRGEAGSSASR